MLSSEDLGCCCAVYSIATNYTFKWPVLAGALACMASNLLYVLSYDARALWLLVLSRFLMGFGARPTLAANPACSPCTSRILCLIWGTARLTTSEGS